MTNKAPMIADALHRLRGLWQQRHDDTIQTLNDVVLSDDIEARYESARDTLKMCLSDLDAVLATVPGEQESLEQLRAERDEWRKRFGLQTSKGWQTAAEADELHQQTWKAAGRTRPNATVPGEGPESQIDCPLCGVTVKQVSSATLSLALWQHVNVVCPEWRKPAPPLDWQPMATAPKDGTPILVSFTSIGIHRVFWSDLPFGPGIGCWCVTDIRNEDKPLRGYVEKDATGWMPLPDPPAAVPQAAQE